MPNPLFTPALSVSEIPVFPALFITVNGIPVCRSVTPEISQLSASTCSKWDGAGGSPGSCPSPVGSPA